MDSKFKKEDAAEKPAGEVTDSTKSEVKVQ